MDCCNSGTLRATLGTIACYDTANGMDCCNPMLGISRISSALPLRYRERYGLLQLSKMAKEGKVIISYDTANGMDCCNDKSTTETAQDVPRYDTANGMDCCNNQIYEQDPDGKVTIPRTVWTVATSPEAIQESLAYCYDTANGMDCCNTMLF